MRARCLILTLCSTLIAVQSVVIPRTVLNKVVSEWRGEISYHRNSLRSIGGSRSDIGEPTEDLHRRVNTEPNNQQPAPNNQQPPPNNQQPPPNNQQPPPNDPNQLPPGPPPVNIQPIPDRYPSIPPSPQTEPSTPSQDQTPRTPSIPGLPDWIRDPNVYPKPKPNEGPYPYSPIDVNNPPPPGSPLPIDIKKNPLPEAANMYIWWSYSESPRSVHRNRLRIRFYGRVPPKHFVNLNDQQKHDKVKVLSASVQKSVYTVLSNVRGLKRFISYIDPVATRSFSDRTYFLAGGEFETNEIDTHNRDLIIKAVEAVMTSQNRHCITRQRHDAFYRWARASADESRPLKPGPKKEEVLPPSPLVKIPGEASCKADTIDPFRYFEGEPTQEAEDDLVKLMCDNKLSDDQGTSNS